MKYRVKFDDPSGRWKAGEIGDALPNDYPRKYDVKLDFGRIVYPPGTTILGRPLLESVRHFYFHWDEVERVEEKRPPAPPRRRRAV